MTQDASLVAEQAVELREQFRNARSPFSTGTGTLVKGDPFRIQQVVANLLSNALKYSTTDVVVARPSSNGNGHAHAHAAPAIAAGGGD